MTNADDLDFTGRTILVTGAGTSIGRAVVLEFAARGARVIISDADEPAARAVEHDARALEARLCEAPVLVVPAVIEDAAGVERLRREAEAFARVDILVRADVPPPRPTFFDGAARGDAPPSDPAEAATGRLARAFVPGMMDGGWGRIVVIGVVSTPSSLTRSLSMDLGEYGITVNEVDIGAATGAPRAIGRAARPDEVAFAVACLCSARSGAITGSVLRVDGGTAVR